MTRSVDLLVLGATIVTARPDGLVIDNGAIAVSGDRIVDIGPRDALEPGYSAARTLAVDGALVFAGLVDTHTHLYQTLLKGLGDDLPLMEWLDACTLPSIPHLTPRMCYVAAALGCIESLRSGCTTLFDYMVDHPNADVYDAILQAFHDVGIQGVLGRGCEPSVGPKLGGQLLELRPVGQLAMPEEIGDLFVGHLLGQVGDHVAAVDEPPVLPVDHADLGLRREDALEAGAEFAHLNT